MITEKVELKIENAKKEYTFLHISDVHVSCMPTNDDEGERNYAIGSTEKWTRDGITPIERFESFIRFASEAKPDAVILSGDAIEICREHNIAFLRESFAKFPCPVLFATGNHETFGLNGAPYDHHYADLMKGSPKLWCEDLGDLLVVGVDNCRKNITREQIDGLREILNRGVPTILVMHVPIVTDGLREKIADFWGEDDVDYFEFCGKNADHEVKEFGDLVKNSDSIIAVLAGHVHFAHTDEIAEGKKLLVAAPLFEGFVREIKVK